METPPSPQSPRPYVSLVTDYGTRDSYVGELKGAMLAVAPGLHLVDLTHEIPAFQIGEASYLIDRLARPFPAGSIFVCVIDPGVGTARKPILLETANGQFFVGPNNGIFSALTERAGCRSAWHLDQPRYWRDGGDFDSTTFHGRDIFGPVAAHLASGVKPWLLGSKLPVEALIMRKVKPAIELGDPAKNGCILGTIVYIDDYGNFITNVPRDWIEKLAKLASKDGRSRFKICIEPDEEYDDENDITANRSPLFEIPLIHAFGEVAPGEMGLLIGSGGAVEIVAREASVSDRCRGRVSPGNLMQIFLVK